MRFMKIAALCGLAAWSSVSGAAAQAPIPADLVFTRVTPCRAFVTSTALAANQARTFVVNGTAAEFTAQGGPSAGCGVPPSAAAVAISLTSFASTGSGHLRSTAFGDPITGTQVLSFRTNVTETSGVIAGVNAGKLTIKAYTAATKVAGDITGYFAPPMHVEVDSRGVVFSKTSRLVSTQKGGAGDYVFIFDRPTDNCVALSSPSTIGYNTISGAYRNYVQVYVTSNITNEYFDGPFQLLVSC